jgi:hypothetical protein
VDYQRFGQIDARLDRMADHLERLADQVGCLGGRFDDLQRTLLQVGGGLTGTVILACTGLIATQI